MLNLQAWSQSSQCYAWAYYCSSRRADHQGTVASLDSKKLMGEALLDLHITENLLSFRAIGSICCAVADKTASCRLPCNCLNINIQNFFSFVLMCWSFCVSALVAEHKQKEAAKARRGYVSLHCECPGLFCVPCPACVEFWSHPYFRPNRCSDYSYAYIESLLARPMAPPPPPQPVPQPAVVAPPRPLPRRSGRVRREPCRYQSVDFRAWVFCSIFFSMFLADRLVCFFFKVCFAFIFLCLFS